ncbi:ATP-binding protein [Mesorhizobium sp. CA7]|uniref:ATP-binding protein n=1 Tax=Mesorhizobium sp. CA7 TaxID=588501 RepID=UPI001CCBB36D|nr:ATP-binding protein [Mesorhizobium sp. CA7]MBZ9812647.1 ATP-binding protein [Mesorhizobium sp. CA7]
MDTLHLQPGQDHLEKIAKTNDPLRGIIELVWNSLDGDAIDVSVEFDRNPLGGLQAIRVVDDGSGMRGDALRTEFHQLGESWKKSTPRTPKYSRAMHGKEGRGRLRFFSIAGLAVWKSTYDTPEGMQRVTAQIEAAQLARCDVEDSAVTDETTETGTIVELSRLKDTYDWLLSREAFLLFSATFAPYILQYPNVSIRYNDEKIVPSASVKLEAELPVGPIQGLKEPVTDLRLKVIEWNGAIQDRKIYFGTDEGIALASQPAGVTAPGFEYSAYAYSTFFRRMHDLNMLELGDLTDPDLQIVLDHVRSSLTDYFRTRQSQNAIGLIDELKAEGAYPYEGEPQNDVEVKERQVFDIATYAVSSYSRTFKRADVSMRRMTLTLLREALRHNPESITMILKAIVDLPKNKQDEFSSLLEKTNLGNIISASSLIADRVTALEVIKGMVFDPSRRISTRERGELDVIVQSNTWIFGEEFHISLPEIGLTRVMQRVATELGRPKRKEQVKTPDGQIGRADAFLGRAIPYPDQNHKEFLLLELKRPSLVVGRKEMDQLESYAVTITGQPEYLDNSTAWTFFLMTTAIEPKQMHRVTQANRPPGLFLDMPRAKVWSKHGAKSSEMLRQGSGLYRTS